MVRKDPHQINNVKQNTMSNKKSKKPFEFFTSSSVQEHIEHILSKLNNFEHEGQIIPCRSKVLTEAYAKMGITIDSVDFYNMGKIVINRAPIVYRKEDGEIYITVNNQHFNFHGTPTGFDLTSGYVVFNDSGLLVKVVGIKANPNVNPASWINLFKDDEWKELVQPLPPQPLNVPSGLYQVELVEGDAMKLYGRTELFSRTNSNGYTYVPGDVIAQLYAPFRSSDTGEIVRYWKHYKLTNSPNFVANPANLHALNTKVQLLSISSLLPLLIKDINLPANPTKKQRINYPDTDDYLFEFVGFIYGLRYNGSDYDTSEGVLLRYKDELIAVAAVTSLKRLMGLENHLTSIQLKSVSEFNGRWFCNFTPLTNARPTWNSDYQFDVSDTGLMLPAAIEPQTLDVEFEVITTPTVDSIPF